MRIVGGSWKGRRLETLSENDITRPTSDRVREALTSMVLSELDYELTDIAVLDCFAGSGALGIEMLSRGAARACFIEKDRRARACLKHNLASIVVDESRYELVGGDTFSVLFNRALKHSPFHLVLLDPPYRFSASKIAQLLFDAQASQLLCEDALVIYERDEHNPSLDVVGLNYIKTRRYGRTAIDLLRRAI